MIGRSVLLPEFCTGRSWDYIKEQMTLFLSHLQIDPKPLPKYKLVCKGCEGVR